MVGVTYIRSINLDVCKQKNSVADHAVLCTFPSVRFPAKTKLFTKTLSGLMFAGPFYNQYLVNYERLIVDHLSVNIAGGGSPNAEYLSPSFKYTYFQAELRGYPLSKSIDKLYTGFGAGMYFSDTLIDFSQWDISQNKKGSTAAAVYGEVGWKFVIPTKNKSCAFFIDPSIFLYSISPLSLSTVRTSDSNPFVYKPFSAMCYITAGIVF